MSEGSANKIIHVPGHLNIVADLMFRPPQAVPAPGAAMAASVKAPSGSLAVSQVAGGTAGAFFLTWSSWQLHRHTAPALPSFSTSQSSQH